jgi:hypothetical protein
VVVCYGFADRAKLSAELDFVYTRSRLNVALSRAKQKVVIIVAESLLNPDADVFASEERNAAFGLLDAVRAACVSPEENGCVYLDFESVLQQRGATDDAPAARPAAASGVSDSSPTRKRKIAEVIANPAAIESIDPQDAETMDLMLTSSANSGDDDLSRSLSLTLSDPGDGTPRLYVLRAVPTGAATTSTGARGALALTALDGAETESHLDSQQTESQQSLPLL